jgi:hypothetical protein
MENQENMMSGSDPKSSMTEEEIFSKYPELKDDPMTNKKISENFGDVEDVEEFLKARSSVVKDPGYEPHDYEIGPDGVVKQESDEN